LEVSVLNDDEINDVQGGQDGPQVVEDLKINKFLEGVGVELALRVEEPIHLIDDVLSQPNYLLNCLEQLLIHCKHP
jgi:hypothetical protein